MALVATITVQPNPVQPNQVVMGMVSVQNTGPGTEVIQSITGSINPPAGGGAATQAVITQPLLPYLLQPGQQMSFVYIQAACPSVGTYTAIASGHAASGDFAAPPVPFVVQQGDVSSFSVTPSGGTSSRTLSAKLGEILSVKDFGAKGDGTTDDYPAFLAAVAALPSAGGVIVVPDATGYKIGTEIAVTKPVEWRIGNTTITGPTSGYIFNVQANGTKILGSASTTLRVSTGGSGGIYNNEAMNTRYDHLTIDMNGVASAIGFYHYGGWYVSLNDISIPPANVAASSVGFRVYSHTLGAPGPTGSYGGIYVSTYTNLQTKDAQVDSDGTSFATTLTFTNLDAKYLYVARSRAITFVQPVIQALAAQTTLIDLTDCDATTFLGGDYERGGLVGAQTIYNLTGNVRGFRSIGNLLANFNSGYSDTYVNGTLGDGCELNDWTQTGGAAAAGPTPAPPLRSGGAGTLGQRFKANGWNVVHHVGVDYSGDTFEIGANLTAISSSQGNLADTGNGGVLLEFNTSGQFLVKTATAGANPRTLTTAGQIDAGGLHIAGQTMAWQSAAPGSGTWARGDVVWNTTATAGGTPGWVCTAAGSPGTWKAMANLAP